MTKIDICTTILHMNITLLKFNLKVKAETHMWIWLHLNLANILLVNFSLCIWYTTNIIFSNLIDRPTIQPIPDQKTIVGETLSLTCQVTAANPKPDMYTWTSVGDGNFSQTGPVLTIPSIQQRHAGTYRCTAVNTMIPTNGSSQQGTDTEDVVVDVLCMCTEM